MHSFQRQRISDKRPSVFFWRGGLLGQALLRSMQVQRVPVADHPLDDLAFLEFHRPCDGGGEVDVPLRAVLALDELDLRGVAHNRLLS
jgi:hypothetical protein